jgi:hypothetical protein
LKQPNKQQQNTVSLQKKRNTYNVLIYTIQSPQGGMRSLNVLEHFLLLKLLAFNHVKCVFSMSISDFPYFISPLTSNCKVKIPYYYINAHQIPWTFISHFGQNLNPFVLHGTGFIRIDFAEKCYTCIYGNAQNIKFSSEWNIWNIFVYCFFSNGLLSFFVCTVN